MEERFVIVAINPDGSRNPLGYHPDDLDLPVNFKGYNQAQSAILNDWPNMVKWAGESNVCFGIEKWFMQMGKPYVDSYKDFYNVYWYEQS